MLGTHFMYDRISASYLAETPTYNFPFYLKNDKDDSKKSPIQLRTFINGNLFRYGIGYSIYPKLWNSEKQRPESRKTKINPYKKANPNIDIELSNINKRIDNIISSKELKVILLTHLEWKKR